MKKIYFDRLESISLKKYITEIVRIVYSNYLYMIVALFTETRKGLGE
jgi:hypothetical protein